MLDFIVLLYHKKGNFKIIFTVLIVFFYLSDLDVGGKCLFFVVGKLKNEIFNRILDID